MQKFAYLKVDIRGTKVIEYSDPEKIKAETTIVDKYEA
jgi:hypothetical protein